MAKRPVRAPTATAAPVASAEVPATPQPAPAAGATISMTTAELFEAMRAFHEEHGAQLDMPDEADLAAEPVIKLRSTSPASIERFVAAAQAHRLVCSVQVLATHVELEVRIPLEGSDQ